MPIQNLTKNYQQKLAKEKIQAEYEAEIEKINQENKKIQEENEKAKKEYEKQLEEYNQQLELIKKYETSNLNQSEFHQLFGKTFEQKYGKKSSDAEEFAYYNYRLSKGFNLDQDEIRNRAYAGIYIGKTIRNELGGNAYQPTYYKSNKGIYTPKKTIQLNPNFIKDYEAKQKYFPTKPSESKILTDYLNQMNHQKIPNLKYDKTTPRIDTTESGIILQNAQKGFSNTKNKINIQKELERITEIGKQNYELSKEALLKAYKEQLLTLNKKGYSEKVYTTGIAGTAGIIKTTIGTPFEYTTEKIQPYSERIGKDIWQNALHYPRKGGKILIQNIPNEYKNNLIWKGGKIGYETTRDIIKDPAGLYLGTAYLTRNKGEGIKQIQQAIQERPLDTSARIITPAVIIYLLTKSAKGLTNYTEDMILLNNISPEFRAEAKALRQATKPAKTQMKPIKPIDLTEVQQITPDEAKQILKLFKENPNLSMGGSNALFSAMKKNPRPKGDVEIDYKTWIKNKEGLSTKPKELIQLEKRLNTGPKDKLDTHPYEQMVLPSVIQRGKGIIPIDNVMEKAILKAGNETTQINIARPGGVAWSKAMDAFKLDSTTGKPYRYWKDSYDAIKSIYEFYQREAPKTINPKKRYDYYQAIDRIEKNWPEIINATEAPPKGTEPIPYRKIIQPDIIQRKWIDFLDERGKIDPYSKIGEYEIRNINNIGKEVYELIKNTRGNYYPIKAQNNYSPNYEYKPDPKKTRYEPNEPINKYVITETPPDYPITTTPNIPYGYEPSYPDYPYEPNTPKYTEKPLLPLPKLTKNKEKGITIYGTKKQENKKSGWTAQLYVGKEKYNDKYSYPSKELAILRGLYLTDQTRITHTQPKKGKGIPSSKKHHIQAKKFYQKNGTYYEKKRYWLDKPQEKNEYMKQIYQKNY